MTIQPDFFVFSSPVEQEGNAPKTCFIALQGLDDPAAFADHLEADTLLSVDGYEKRNDFFFTFGHYYFCSLVQVHLKEDDAACSHLQPEQVAIAETYSYLTRLSVEKK